MATIYTHSIVGLGLARLYTGRRMPWDYWTLAAVLHMVPDLDVFSIAAYGSASGHRGWTHSLLFALVLGTVVAAATYRRYRVQWWSLALLFFVIIASHGLLDAMTRPSEGVLFFWPLEGRWGNWGPLPVSDIAFELPDPRSSRAIRAELFWIWLPLGVVVGLITVYRKIRCRQSAAT